MTPAALEKRVLLWQKRLTYLGVGHWRVPKVEIVETDEFKARASIPSSYDYVNFAFDTEFLTESPEDIDRVIVHEWIHVAMRDLDEAIGGAQSWFPEASWHDFDDRVDHERESFVDRLATQIYNTWER